MVKKNTTKDTEHSISFFGKAAAVLKNETVHFVAGLILVIFSVYLLLAFSSFFFKACYIKVNIIICSMNIFSFDELQCNVTILHLHFQKYAFQDFLKG